jgi:hypothetical protein
VRGAFEERETFIGEIEFNPRLVRAMTHLTVELWRLVGDNRDVVTHGIPVIICSKSENLIYCHRGKHKEPEEQNAAQCTIENNVKAAHDCKSRQD